MHAMRKRKDSIKDMTSGKPLTLILGFSVPLLFGFLFQQFYSMVDTIIVGKLIGVYELAAVGSTGSINFLVIGFCMGICSGFSIPVAQRFGAGDYKSLRRYVAGSILLSSVSAIIMTITVSLFCRQILVLMDTPENIINQAYSYILVIFIGIPVTCLYNLTSSIIRALGDSKTPVIFLFIASFLNIIFDLFFIAVLQTGVEGAAYATVISQFIAGFSCLIYIKKKFPILKLTRDDFHVTAHELSILCNMGIPMGLQYSITAIGSVILQKAVNTLGSDSVAAVTAASRLYSFVACPFDAMGATMATYGGQNVGAKKLSRLKEGYLSCTILGLCYSILSFLGIFLFCRYLLLLFLSSEETVILGKAAYYITIQTAFFFPLALVNITRFLIQGMGFPRFAILAGVCEMFARILIAVLFIPMFGFPAAAFASPLAWLSADAFLIPAFFHVYHKLKKIFTTPAEETG